MKPSTLILSFIFLYVSANCDAFTITPQNMGNNNARLFASMVDEDFTKQGNADPLVEGDKLQMKQRQTVKKSKGHKDGLFSPVVQLSKTIIGDKNLNKVRGKAIAVHSDVIGKFVETSDSEFGETVLKQLFDLADKNKNGTIEISELGTALKTLGFNLNEKQIVGIFNRADVDDSGTIDFNEWKKEAPRTLRTNLIKMAKKNGGEMGLLV